MKNAGTLILVCSIILWALSIFPVGVNYVTVNCYLGIIGNAIAPIFTPLGFGTWQAAVAILSGLAAKEVVVASFGTIAGIEEIDDNGMRPFLHDLFTPLSAFSFMAVTLLYTPCIATIGAIRQETNSNKWPLIMCAITITTAYVVSFLIFNIGTLLGFH